MQISLILAALLPSLILLGYVLYQDRKRPEPPRLLLRAFVLGMFSTWLSTFISTPLASLGVFSCEPEGIIGNLRLALFGAAIPEECAKLFVLWLVLRNNPWFDEHFDGIVYAVCVGMGFAAFENIEYLFAAGSNWVTTGLGRSLTAIPGHFAFAVIMGYYYSLNHFDKYRAPGAHIKMWLYPVLAHGIYDTIAMMAEVSPEMSGVITIVILLGCFWGLKFARKRMQTHLVADAVMNGGVGVDEQ